MNAMSPRIRPWIAPAAGVLIFLGERVFAGGVARPVLDTAGVVLLAAALGWTLLSFRPREGAGGAVRLLAAMPAGIFLLAALLYFSTLLVSGQATGLVDWPALLDWGWVLALLLGAFPYLFVELSLHNGAGAPLFDPARLRRAAFSGLALGLVLALIVVLNFIFTRLPWQWDLAYFKTAQPSTATLDVVRGVEEPVDVALFFPEGHLVLSLLESYFAGLKGAAGKVTVHSYDAELKPLQAKAFKVRGNGVVVLRRGTFSKDIRVGMELNRARRELKKFDRSFFAALLEVSSEKRVAYFSVGHGERNERSAGGKNFRTGMKTLRSLLEERNFQVKPLGASEGLGREIPKDAALLLIVAPQTPFLPGELAAVKDFLEQGGRLLIFLDPERLVGATQAAQPGSGLADLLASYGMKFRPVLLANDRYFARRTFTKADHALLVTIGYQSHPAMRTLRAQAKQNPLLLLGSGAWRRGKVPAHLRLQEALKGMTGTWADGNRNFVFDRGREKREIPTLALALSPKRKKRQNGGEGPAGPQVLAFADADLAADFLMQNRANRLLLAESIRWVAGSELPAGLPNVEEDTQIRHAKQDELVWFYLPVFAVPLLVLMLGYFLSGRPALGRRG